jgi:hypothetical protein
MLFEREGPQVSVGPSPPGAKSQEQLGARSQER